MNNKLYILFSLLFSALGINSMNAQNLLTLSPSFEDGAGTGPNADGNGPGSSLNGGSWFRVNNSGNGTAVENLIYRKTTSPAPQHLTAYMEAVTPADAAMNAAWKLQVMNNQNLNTTLTNSTEYRISFYYQNTTGHSFVVSVENVDGSANVVYQNINSEAATWTLYTTTFTMNTTTVNNARLKFNFGANAGTTLIDNVVLEPTAPAIVNLLTTNPSFEENNTSGPGGDGNGPGSSLNGGAWFRANNSGNGTAADQLIYRKTKDPAPQHLTGYLEAITPNEAAFNAGWKLQAINQLNMTTALTDGATYTLSFYYRNTAGHTFSVSMEKNNGSATLFNQSINSEATEWTLFSHTFQMNTTTLNADGRLKFNFGANAGTTQIDNVVLYSPSTLPVSLISYQAVAIGTEAHLIWKTASETNNKSFTISRSSDGTNYKEIAMVEASASGQYSFVDRKMTPGHYFYRLAQFDNDGTSKILGIRKVTFEGSQDITLSVFPNPAKGAIQLQTTGLQDGTYSLKLLNTQGIIANAQAINLQSNKGRVNLPTSLKPGIYYLSIITPGGAFSKKIMVN